MNVHCNYCGYLLDMPHDPDCPKAIIATLTRENGELRECNAMLQSERDAALARVELLNAECVAWRKAHADQFTSE